MATTTKKTTETVEATRRIVRHMAEQMLRHARGDDFDPYAAITQMRGTAALMEAEVRGEGSGECREDER